MFTMFILSVNIPILLSEEGNLMISKECHKNGGCHAMNMIPAVMWVNILLYVFVSTIEGIRGTPRGLDVIAATVTLLKDKRTHRASSRSLVSSHFPQIDQCKF